MQLFGDLNILSSVRVLRLNWISRVNRMDSKIGESQGYNNNPQGRQLRGGPKKQMELYTNRF